MGKYSQANRPMRVDTPLETDLLLLEGFEAEEGVSRPYLYTLQLLSESAEVDPDDLLRQPVLVTLEAGETNDLFLTHGIVRSFTALDMAEGLTRYRAEVVPAFWFLTQTRDCRIFQNQSVIEIVSEILRKPTTVGNVRFEVRCNRSYAPREYCVQYRESDFNFVTRLLEDEGIFYWFEHSEDDHTLVLADAHTAFRPCAGFEKVRMDPRGGPGEQVVKSLVQEHSTRSYDVMLADYDPLQPALRLYGTAQGDQERMDPVFDYPGAFTDLDGGEYRARVDLERREKDRHRATGTSSCRGLRAGTVIEIEGHFRDEVNRNWTLDRIRHRAHSGSFRAWEHAEFHYSNEFVALPDDVPYRPDIEARRPRVQGTQTAVVVGKAGEEVWVDEHGRVKVQFHWDRYGSNDENSSCWIRVATQTAGKRWGHIEIPRIGHEVIVDFLEGDPDRPIIVGSVYNADMKTPWELPAKGVVSGIRTRSSKGGGGYNELSMDDTKGKEKFVIHAEKDMSTTVGNNQTRTITNDRKTTVGNDDTEEVSANQKVTVGGERDVSVTGDQIHTIGGSRTADVTGDSTLTTGGSNTQTVGADHVVDATRAVSITSGAQTELNAGTDGLYSAGVNLDLSAGAELTVGAVTVKVNGTGQVEITGTAGVKISTPAALELEGSQVKITGAMVQVNGMVKLN